MTFTIIGNNGTTDTNYLRAGNTYGVGAHTFDVYLNGSLIGDDLAASRLLAGSTIDSFNFQGTSSLGNFGTMAIDDLSYGPVAAVPEPATWLIGTLSVSGVVVCRRRSQSRNLKELRTKRSKP